MGITTVPAAPVADPRASVMTVPQVAEAKRFCSACGSAVGRARDGRSGRTEGFCPKCRAPYSFTPKLVTGEVVGGQYEVVGCLAHGGLGWIYLARDRNVSDRYVVLKGLLNSGDVDAYQAAIAERQFLAEVEHPLIVEIYNFVIHGGAGYIVMEYVGGKSLKSILQDRMRANNNRFDPVPVDQAIAYIIEILPAFSYLHGTGLLYCDFKPDNIIQQGDAIKLIDLGGVRRADDLASAIYGTVGYQAPEIAEVGPTVAGDIHTIGRTIAMLVAEIPGYQSEWVAALPGPELVPLFATHDSLYRLLLKATASNPDDRFQSADEMREQLIGVLREVVASGRTNAEHSTSSNLFEAPTIAGATFTWEQLPALRIDPTDPMAAWLAGVSVSDPTGRLAILDTAAEQSVEIQLARARAAINASDLALARTIIDAMLAADPWEWRALWLAGLGALAAGDAKAATEFFNAGYGQVPGELAPKLALALACEQSGQSDAADQLYSICAATDANYAAPAAFGIARLRLARGDDAGALSALDRVPPTSRSYVESRRQRAAILAAEHDDLGALAAAAASLQGVGLEPGERERLLITIFEAAIVLVRASGPKPMVHIDGIPAEEHALRLGAERAYRSLATTKADAAERHALVDAANRVRPLTSR